MAFFGQIVTHNLYALLDNLRNVFDTFLMFIFKKLLNGYLFSEMDAHCSYLRGQVFYRDVVAKVSYDVPGKLDGNQFCFVLDVCQIFNERILTLIAGV